MLESDRVEVTRAENGERASELMASGDFDVVIVDVNLGKGEETGEQWVYRSRGQLGGSMTVVYTKDESYIQDPDRLREIVKAVLRKTEPEDDKRLQTLPVMAQRKKAAEVIAESVGDIAEDLGQGLGDGVSSEALKRIMMDLFRTWVERHPAPDQPALWVRGRAMTVNDLWAEVEAENPLGERLLELFAEDLKARI